MRCFFRFLSWCIFFLCPWPLCEGTNQASFRNARHSGNLYSSPNLYNSTDSLYSPWSKWTSCSATCGRGIISRKRNCLKSTYNTRGVAVSLCHGDFTEHKICNLKACPSNSSVEKELQCSKYNNQVIAGKLVKTWIPANESPNPCELRCEARTEKIVYGFGKARDGTPCPLGVCLDGRCLAIGCDDRLSSGVFVDMCGVCGGQNSSCVHYKDVYEGQASSASGSRGAYNEVVVIPFGARNLIVRQPLGKNILALQDQKKGIIFTAEHGENKYGGQFEIAGSPVLYRKLAALAEELFIKGPLTEELRILALLQSHNPGIHYEYWLPKQNPIPGANQYLFHQPSIPIPPNLLNRNGKSYTVPFYSPGRQTSQTRSANHHPTKPPFAYPYGETPPKGQERPIFRAVRSTSAPKHRIYSSSYRSSTSKSVEKLKTPDSVVPHLPFKRGIYKRQPALDYYATYRNGSKPIAKAPDTANNRGEITDLTQGDSSISNDNSRHHNEIIRHRTDSSKQEKPSRKGIHASRRVDSPPTKFISNGRLKYSFESTESQGLRTNASFGRFTPAPLTVNVLPLPDQNNLNPHKDRRRDDDALKTRSPRGGSCEPCQKSRNQAKHFCDSDFVIHASVINFEFMHGETRYELDVKQSFKNTLSLLPKEFVWSPDTCRCPKLRTGKEYIVMGRMDNSYRKRESRLLVDRTSFVRTFNLKYVRRLQKLRKDREKKCKKIS